MISSSQKGVTLIELLITLAILSVIMIVITAFQRDVFFLGNVVDQNLSQTSEARSILQPMAAEIRSASASEGGTFALKETSTSTLVFFSDIDNDNLKEEVRYFLDNKTLKKGVKTPTGSPLSYESVTEEITILINNVVNASSATTTSAFEYFDENYNGSATTTPLTQPVAPSDVRLVKVTIRIDEDPDQPPAAREATTQVSIRNLKDNY